MVLGKGWFVALRMYGPFELFIEIFNDEDRVDDISNSLEYPGKEISDDEMV